MPCVKEKGRLKVDDTLAVPNWPGVVRADGNVRGGLALSNRPASHFHCSVTSREAATPMLQSNWLCHEIGLPSFHGTRIKTLSVQSWLFGIERVLCQPRRQGHRSRCLAVCATASGLLRARRRLQRQALRQMLPPSALPFSRHLYVPVYSFAGVCVSLSFMRPESGLPCCD